MGVCFTDINTGTAVGTSGTILRTTDGGTTWTSQISGTTVQFYGVSFIDANNGTVVGYGTSSILDILRTTDGGINWTSQMSGTKNSFRSVSFTDANTGIAVGVKGIILRTTNSGTTWISQTSGTASDLHGVSFVDSNNGWVVGGVSILRTTDGGTTWTLQTSGTTSSLYDVSFVDANTGWAVGDYGAIIKTTDGGTTWTPQLSGTTMFLYDVSFVDTNTGTAVGHSGTILRTTDGGSTWTMQTSGTSGELRGVSFIDVYNGAAVGSGGTILRTTDGGTAWSRQQTMTDQNKFYDVWFTDVNNVTVVGGRLNASSYWGDGIILKTTNWGVIPTVPLAPTYLYALADTFSVNLQWTDNSDNETGFIIQRKDGDSSSVNSFLTINSVSANTTTYVDADLEPNTTYTYRVFAFNDYFNSNFSNLVQTTTLALPPTFQLTVSVTDGWNMVSIPGLHPLNQQVTTWWAGMDPSANVFEYYGSYQAVTAVSPGKGYWMKNLGDQTYSTGDEWPVGGIVAVEHNPISCLQGWNMIGGYEYNAAVSGITTTPPGLQQSPIYGFSGGYQMVDYLIPGYSYWIKLSGNGLINLPSQTFKGPERIADYIKEDWGRIKITDSEGKSVTLYATEKETDLILFELPPMPPTGIFDARYSSGRMAEDLSNETIIQIASDKYPITIKAEGINLTVKDIINGELLNAELKSGEEIRIVNSKITSIEVTGRITGGLPVSYELFQNYPNPFNPSTTIKFAVPIESNVNLSIYNILGELVSTLVNEQKKPGYYEYEFDGKNLASGVYIYRIKAGDPSTSSQNGQAGQSFVETKKMILIK